jgi:hypothetical protein
VPGSSRPVSRTGAPLSSPEGWPCYQPGSLSSPGVNPDSNPRVISVVV